MASVADVGAAYRWAAEHELAGLPVRKAQPRLALTGFHGVTYDALQPR